MWYSLCFLPIIIVGVFTNLLASLFIDFPVLLAWLLTGGFFGRMCPLQFAYANELNGWAENDERAIIRKDSAKRAP